MDIEALVGALTLEEKAALTAGEDMMSTPAIERLGLPKIRVTDGPSGARGPSFPGLGGPSSTCIPCGSAIGASWNPLLAQQLGALVGREALDRGCKGLLAPTVNLHRHPLAGRNFECYSEDPLLSGRLAAGYVRGVQSNGVFATVKHFVGNDAEFERGSISSVIDERSLRELYLLPFEMAVREGGALGIMTAYNRLNGRWLTERPEMLSDLLRGEWGFEGLVMTDWFAVADTTQSLRAGLDLEMPGPGRAIGSAVVPAVTDGRVKGSDLDAAVRRLLHTYDRIGALDGPTPDVNPLPPSPADLDLLRRAGAEATVLLSNDGTLPLDPSSLRRVAIVGPHATAPCVVGGGSASMVTPRLRTPRESISALLLPGTEVLHERGCEADLSATPIGDRVLVSPGGFDAEFFAGSDCSGEVVKRQHLDTLRLAVYQSMPDDQLPDEWSVRVRGTVVPEEDGRFQVALSQSGRARVLIDGETVLDGFEHPPPPGGSDFFGMGSRDLTAELDLTRGVPVELHVEFARADATLGGFRVGFRTLDGDGLLERAVAAAAAADVAVVVVGTTAEWETEGRDRSSFALPGRQPELIGRVTAVNDRTVVVVNAGAPVDLSWADDAAAVLQCGLGGQEVSAAIAGVLMGELEPGGRLPTTIPVCLEHCPSYDNFPGENGELRYGEGLFMGYRGYEHRRIAPRFAFGHGLSYTSFSLGEPELSARTLSPDGAVTVSVPVTNTGTRSGSEVVQCYVAPVSPRLSRPLKELKAFAKVWLEPGGSCVAELRLDSRAFAYWDPGQSDWEEVRSRAFDMFGDLSGRTERRPAGWQVDAGRYDLLVGRSSVEIAHTCRLEIAQPNDQGHDQGES
ncbi:MAG: glycoside hydrolase family 3 protein [Acidimicrobiales bacterium]